MGVGLISSSSSCFYFFFVYIYYDILTVIQQHPISAYIYYEILKAIKQYLTFAYFYSDFDICVFSRVGSEPLNIFSLQFRKNFLCMNLKTSEENPEFLLMILVSIFSKELNENG